MSLYICSLNSGSNGNCYFIGTGKDAILVDAGLSCRETEKRLARSGLDITQVRAVFISHEHTDHIRGVEVLSRKHRLPVYITDATRSHARLNIGDDLVFTFNARQPVEISGMQVLPFAKHHDASDPHSFTVSHGDTVVGVFTDIGQWCSEVATQFNRCHGAFLETNYDEKMLMEGPYPFYLKKRITGGLGHLSNAQALKLFLTYRRQDLSHLLLSHLSAENNCPNLAASLFREHANGTNIVVATRHEETSVYFVSGSGNTIPLREHAAAQMSLF